MKIKLDVTSRWINNGQRASGNLCPVALALWDNPVGFVGLNVSAERIIVAKSSTEGFVHYLHPNSEIRNFIEKFDNYRDAAPFQTDVEFHEITKEDETAQHWHVYIDSWTKTKLFEEYSK